MKKGWQTKRIGEVCEIIKGRKPVLKTTATNGDLPYLVAKVMRGSKEAEFASVKDRNSITVEESETIIICDGSNSGEVFTGFRGILSSTMGKIAKKAEIDDDYLRAFLASTFDVFNGAKTGAAIPHLDKEAMYQLQFPFPSLPEQQRIVGLLDEAFEGLATAKANAEKNLQNARALFESHLQSVFTQGSQSAAEGRGSGWVETTLSRATDGIFTGPFGSLLHKSDYVANGIPLVNPAHITETGIEPDLRKTVSKATAMRLKNYIMREGDIVIGRRGEMGRCALVTEVEDGWLCGTGSFFIKPSNRCDTRYLVRFLRSAGCKARLEKIAGGAVMPNLSNTDLGNLAFDLPPLDRQKAIVEEIDSLHEQTQRLAAIYSRKHAALEALKKSLLHQAFTGGL
jgi:type I restriction enzyme S subunit